MPDFLERAMHNLEKNTVIPSMVHGSVSLVAAKIVITIVLNHQYFNKKHR
jgi:hypothetical protein